MHRDTAKHAKGAKRLVQTDCSDPPTTQIVIKSEVHDERMYMVNYIYTYKYTYKDIY